VLVTAGVASLAALVRREGPKPAPLIPLDLLRAPSFRLSVIASVCCFTGQTAALVALPFLLQHDLKQSALTAGLYMTPWPLSVALTAGLAGRLADRIPTGKLCAIGAGVLATGLAALVFWPLDGDPSALAVFAAVCGVGFGLFQVPNNRNMFFAAPLSRSGAAGGMQGAARLTGQTAGAVLMTLLFTVGPGAPRVGLGVAAVMVLLAGVISIRRLRGT
jgi:DHA2 family multidrug resistance protein-like MFS transporter